jgi:hypothetical protein
MRVISANIVRMYCARGGAWTLSSFSTARIQECSMHIGDT